MKLVTKIKQNKTFTLVYSLLQVLCKSAEYRHDQLLFLFLVSCFVLGTFYPQSCF